MKLYEFWQFRLAILVFAVGIGSSLVCFFQNNLAYYFQGIIIGTAGGFNLGWVYAKSVSSATEGEKTK